MMYQTFTRTWWKKNPKYPSGLEPHAGRKSYHGRYATEEEARKACKAWNDSNNPGVLSKKMEYMED